jgi:hypothetical protein
MSSENDDKELLRDNYPSNSKTKKADRSTCGDGTVQRAKIDKVIVGKAKIQKKSLGKKVAETFLEDNTKSVGSYVVHDVLIPAAKALICDIVGWGGFAEMILFGGSARRGSSALYRDGGKTRINYGGAYRNVDRSSLDRGNGRELSRASRARHDFDDIILETRGEAEEVLSHLVDLVIDYKQATVADLYDLVDITPAFTDNKWGWTDLRDASVNRVRNGYLINLPRTQPLD